MSITLNGTSYDLTYVNVASDFVEQPGAVLTVDPWGMDTITRRWSGRLDKVTTELAKFKRRRDVKDSVYPDLFATEWTMSHDAPFPVLQVTYKGVIDGTVPEPELEHDLRLAEVTLRFTGSDGTDDGTTTTIKYHSPTVTAQYVSKTRPSSPKYQDRIDYGGDAFKIVSMTGDDSRSFKMVQGGASGATIGKTPSRYNAVIEVSSPTFKRKKVGQWWTVTETSEAYLVPTGLDRVKSIIRA